MSIDFISPVTPKSRNNLGSTPSHFQYIQVSSRLHRGWLYFQLSPRFSQLRRNALSCLIFYLLVICCISHEVEMYRYPLSISRSSFRREWPAVNFQVVESLSYLDDFKSWLFYQRDLVSGKSRLPVLSNVY